LCPDAARAPRRVAPAATSDFRRRRDAALVLGLLLALGACASPPPAPPDHQGIPGTRVSLVVPEGFALADRFFGLMGGDGVSAVVVNEIPGPIESVRAAMTAEALAARGLELLHSEPVTIDGRDAVLVDVRRTAAGRELRGWIVAFGEADGSVMISASTSAALADRVGATLRRTLMSAEWNPGEILDPYAGLGFTLAEAGSLKISDRLPSMISFTRGGNRGALAPDDPLLLAGSFSAPIDATDLEGFARRRLDEIAELEAPEVVSKRDLTLGGLPAHELVVSAKDRRSGTPITVYQALVADGDRFFLVQGLVGADKAEEFMPQFREIAHSFRRTP
jgi:hypothetical protein